ncbi:hypothetical protein AWB91_09590 [Mycobacterium paraense]|uniref:Pyridine nucleotide-disulfide oxidoreductase n=1 Tax=Mycobacterium paraense TaxID=767916 RepID=A0ABX3VRT2_9MYCO|nr:FAD-dependent oxidoreductase [Mycobacterium paraense]ORW32734.1 hypothetical protein AWB91_09590 [Mycobacterium paraense]ORW44959.1 hypothetical protein AWB88_04660 [Mycobacterium paraense]
MSQPTYVIVGANLAGGSAAVALRDAGFDGKIVLIGAESYPPYERPPLSKGLLMGGKAPESTYLHPIEFYAEQGIELLLSTTVSRILPRWGAVELEHGSTLPADRILLTTGARPRRLQIPGLELTGVHYLRDINDAIAIRDQLQAQVRVTIIGGGFIGAEVAATARQTGCEVTMLAASARPLHRMLLNPAIAAFFAAAHRSHGVDLRTRCRASAIEGEHGRVRRVVTSDGSAIDTDIVIVGIGTEPASELARDAGIATADGILIDPCCRTSTPNVLAAGDVARHLDRRARATVRLEHWQGAQNQALAAARSMVDRPDPYDEVPWYWSDQYDLNLQVAGLPKIGDAWVLRGDINASSFSFLSLRDGRLSCIVAVNRPRDVRPAIKMIEAGFPVVPHRLADVSIELRHQLSQTVGGVPTGGTRA